MSRRFSQVDVFSKDVFGGNPVAVVHDAEGLSDERMQTFAAWTNLSETTFLPPPTRPGADYRLRICTPPASCPSLGTPPSVRRTRGWRPEVDPPPKARWCRSAPRVRSG